MVSQSYSTNYQLRNLVVSSFYKSAEMFLESSCRWPNDLTQGKNSFHFSVTEMQKAVRTLLLFCFMSCANFSIGGAQCLCMHVLILGLCICCLAQLVQLAQLNKFLDFP